MSEKKEYCLNCGNETIAEKYLRELKKVMSKVPKEYEIVVCITVDVAQQRI